MFSNTLRCRHPNHRRAHLLARFYTRRTLLQLAQYGRYYVHIFSSSVVDHHQGPQVDGRCLHKALPFEYIPEIPTS